jgi:adenylate cyclase
MKRTVTLITLLFSFLHITYSQDQHLVDSLQSLLETPMQDTSRIQILNRLSRAYMGNDHDKAMDYAIQSLDLSGQIGYKKGISSSYNNIGNIFYRKGELHEALKNYSASLKINEELGLKSYIASSNNNIGNIYKQQGNYPEALKNYSAALKISEELGDKSNIAGSSLNIGTIYYFQGNYPEALKNYSTALKIFEELGQKQGIVSTYNNIGNIYRQQGNYPGALENFTEGLKISEEAGDKQSIASTYINIGNIYEREGNYPEALTKYLVALKISEELGDKNNIAGLYLNIGKINTRQKKYDEASGYLNKALSLSKAIGVLETIKECYSGLSELSIARGNYKQALEQYKLYIDARDSLVNKENTRKIVQQQMQYEFDKKESVAKAEQEKKDALAQKELQKQKWVRNGLIIGFATVLLIAYIFFRQRNRISKEKKISEKERKKAEEEKKRSEELLLNILPYEIAEELKSTGTSKAKTYSMVSVMFTDFKDFTRISENVSAELLVDEIHYCFSAFDAILEKYKIEKIKTIGDSYMCASGLPVLNYTHATDLVNAAIEIRDFIRVHKREKEARGEIPFDMRIGIHTGAVVAGIVGVKKYSYDIWGDTVNIAARMEQNSEAGKINISGSTYLLVKDQFNCVYRGKIEAKNKGKVDMYFVEPSFLPLP